MQRIASAASEDIVRRGIDAYNRGDFEALLEQFDPAVMLHDPGRTGRSFHGHDGLMRFWGEWLENWDEYRLEPVEFVDDGEEIFVACQQRARGKLSGVEISQQLFSVYRFRDSKVVELRVYADRAPALDSMHG